MTIESTLERIAVALETIASGKAPEPAQPAAPAEPAKRGRKSAQAAPEADLFGSASADTAPAKSPAASTTSTATSTASPSDDDLFGEKPAAKEEPKSKATIEQLRKALVDCQTKHGHKDHALGVLKKFTRDGNPTISSLDEAKYQDVIDACAKYVPTK